jgi:asparagine synthase (glutamine-hydrolysing)
MFAFALWDGGRRRLLLARDRPGKKPLYYRLDGDGIAFASEPKAFLAEPSFEPRPDVGALYDYLTYHYVPGPVSAFQGVRRVPPAHYLLVEDGQVRLERYWQLRSEPKRRLSEADAAAELLARLRNAVRARLVADVPLGAFLSGGIDSSAVVALMAEAGAGPVRTFSIGFEEPSAPTPGWSPAGMAPSTASSSFGRRRSTSSRGWSGTTTSPMPIRRPSRPSAWPSSRGAT